jgi:hypothetical protein
MTFAPALALLLLQAAAPRTAMDLILGGTWPTKVILLVLAASRS